MFDELLMTVSPEDVGKHVELYRLNTTEDTGFIRQVIGNTLHLKSDRDSKIRMYSIDAYFIIKTGKEPKTTTSKCDCGAKHTSFPNHHLRWCQLFEKRS